jgi:hypothetical protein
LAAFPAEVDDESYLVASMWCELALEFFEMGETYEANEALDEVHRTDPAIECSLAQKGGKR